VGANLFDLAVLGSPEAERGLEPLLDMPELDDVGVGTLALLGVYRRYADEVELVVVGGGVEAVALGALG